MEDQSMFLHSILCKKAVASSYLHEYLLILGTFSRIRVDFFRTFQVQEAHLFLCLCSYQLYHYQVVIVND